MTTLNDIRASFLAYFESHDHTVLPSAPLVPFNDPTLLFVNSGMVQFKDIFTGRQESATPRAVTAQKCLRAGGKHNDLDNVGYTARHHTFFEMLGNFSFGDYFKERAIPLAWKMVTEELGIDRNRLLVTVYAEDDEAASIWRKVSGLGDDRILRIPTADNFWAMGPTGPCGPCSEIFFDHGESVPGGPPGTPEEDGDRFVEIWNLVFMQYEQHADGQREPLPRPSIDTGMGLERMGAVLEGTHDNYATDVFRALIEASAELSSTDPDGSCSAHHRVIADHLRAACFLIADGVLPSNEGRGYVLRRIMRRAMRHAHLLEIGEPLLWHMVPVLVRKMGQAFPELTDAAARAGETLRLEETRFRETLERGLGLLQREIGKLGEGEPLPGKVAFRLFDTYGFPLDLTRDALRECQRAVDIAGFEAEMAVQRTRSRRARLAAGPGESDTDVALWLAAGEDTPASEFLGYQTTTAEALVQVLAREGGRAESAAVGDRVSLVVNQTPFYAEAGGQVGDTGMIRFPQGRARVVAVQRRGALIIHEVEVLEGVIEASATVVLEVDASRRARICSNHSATHLLHEALRKRLGPQTAQRGSLVAPDRLRFDFSHSGAVDEEELARVETDVNAQIRADHEVSVLMMERKAAVASGARALFGEKYGDEVRVVSMGGPAGGGTGSVELCGGTHVRQTGEIGVFKIIGEEAVAAGIRRVEALSGEAAFAWLAGRDRTLRNAATILGVQPDQVVARVEVLATERRRLERELAELRRVAAAGTGDGAEEIRVVAGIPFLARQLHHVTAKDLRGVVDDCKRQIGSGVVAVAANIDGKAALAVGVSADLAERVSAVDLVREAAQAVGGSGGGGRPDLAQAGGPDGSRIQDALDAVERAIG